MLLILPRSSETHARDETILHLTCPEYTTSPSCAALHWSEPTYLKLLNTSTEDLDSKSGRTGLLLFRSSLMPPPESSGSSGPSVSASNFLNVSQQGVLHSYSVMQLPELEYSRLLGVNVSEVSTLLLKSVEQ